MPSRSSTWINGILPWLRRFARGALGQSNLSVVGVPVGEGVWRVWRVLEGLEGFGLEGFRGFGRFGGCLEGVWRVWKVLEGLEGLEGFGGCLEGLEDFGAFGGFWRVWSVCGLANGSFESQ